MTWQTRHEVDVSFLSAAPPDLTSRSIWTRSGRHSSHSVAASRRSPRPLSDGAHASSPRLKRCLGARTRPCTFSPFFYQRAFYKNEATYSVRRAASAEMPRAILWIADKQITPDALRPVALLLTAIFFCTFCLWRTFEIPLYLSRAREQLARSVSLKFFVTNASGSAFKRSCASVFCSVKYCSLLGLFSISG